MKVRELKEFLETCDQDLYVFAKRKIVMGSDALHYTNIDSIEVELAHQPGFIGGKAVVLDLIS